MAAATITCTQCGHVNEGERIYCHNCGVKLDRSVLPPAAVPGPKSQAEAQKRVVQMTNPRRGTGKRSLQAFGKSVLYAAVVAAVVQMGRAPRDTPPFDKDQLVEAPPIGILLEQAAQNPAPQSLVANETDINNYLRSTIRGSDKDAPGNVKFERLYVDLTPGVCHLHLQETVFGFPLHFGSDYQLAIKADKLVPRNVGGSIGRMPMHPVITKFAGLIFGKIWAALKNEQKQMDGLQSIDVRQDAIELVTRPVAV